MSSSKSSSNTTKGINTKVTTTNTSNIPIVSSVSIGSGGFSAQKKLYS